MIKKNFFLILNEIFEIIYYFRQPLFRMGFRTSQQIKQLFMFLLNDLKKMIRIKLISATAIVIE